MAKRIVDTSVAAKSLYDTSKTGDIIDPGKLAEALQAELIGSCENPTSTPISILAIQRELLTRLRSSGGRPALSCTTRRQKIPLTDTEWEKLQRLAEQFAKVQVTATPGQIASILIHCALKNLDEAKSVI